MDFTFIIGAIFVIVVGSVLLLLAKNLLGSGNRDAVKSTGECIQPSSAGKIPASTSPLSPSSDKAALLQRLVACADDCFIPLWTLTGFSTNQLLSIFREGAYFRSPTADVKTISFGSLKGVDLLKLSGVDSFTSENANRPSLLLTFTGNLAISLNVEHASSNGVHKPIEIILSSISVTLRVTNHDEITFLEASIPSDKFLASLMRPCEPRAQDALVIALDETVLQLRCDARLSTGRFSHDERVADGTAEEGESASPSPSRRQLSITVVQAIGLPKQDCDGLFCLISTVPHSEIFKTSTVKSDSDPFWDQNFQIPVEPETDDIKIDVCALDEKRRKRIICFATLSISEIELNADKRYSLMLLSKQFDESDSVTLTVDVRFTTPSGAAGAPPENQVQDSPRRRVQQERIQNTTVIKTFSENIDGLWAGETYIERRPSEGQQPEWNASFLGNGSTIHDEEGEEGDDVSALLGSEAASSQLDSGSQHDEAMSSLSPESAAKRKSLGSKLRKGFNRLRGKKKPGKDVGPDSSTAGRQNRSSPSAPVPASDRSVPKGLFSSDQSSTLPRAKSEVARQHQQPPPHKDRFSFGEPSTVTSISKDHSATVPQENSPVSLSTAGSQRSSTSTQPHVTSSRGYSIGGGGDAVAFRSSLSGTSFGGGDQDHGHAHTESECPGCKVATDDEELEPVVQLDVSSTVPSHDDVTHAPSVSDEQRTPTVSKVFFDQKARSSTTTSQPVPVVGHFSIGGKPRTHSYTVGANSPAQELSSSPQFFDVEDVSFAEGFLDPASQTELRKRFYSTVSR